MENKESLVVLQIGPTILKMQFTFLKRQKIEIRCALATPLLSKELKKINMLTQKVTASHMCAAALFTIAKIWK